MSQVLCPVLATDHKNIITKDNLDSLLLSTYDRTPGTRVSVSCYVPASFTLTGPSKVVCAANGKWSPSIPTCTRRSSSGNNNNGGNTGAGTTEDNNISTTETDDDSILSDYSIIVIAVAAAFVAILIIILIFFLCKQFGISRQRQKEDDDFREPLTVHYTEPPPRPQVAVVQVDTLFSSPSQVQDVYTGPNSPPSWHSHPIIVMADQYKQRTWSELSVDQYLREMETSRRENPNHSWRDFATLSSYYSRRSISSYTSIV